VQSFIKSYSKLRPQERWQTDANNLFHAICYSNWTDKYHEKYDFRWDLSFYTDAVRSVWLDDDPDTAKHGKHNSCVISSTLTDRSSFVCRSLLNGRRRRAVCLLHWPVKRDSQRTHRSSTPLTFVALSPLCYHTLLLVYRYFWHLQCAVSASLLQTSRQYNQY